MKKIVLTGGGTLGHVTPHLALIPRLLEAGYEIHYIGSENGMEAPKLRSVEGITYHAVNLLAEDEHILPGALEHLLDGEAGPVDPLEQRTGIDAGEGQSRGGIHADGLLKDEEIYNIFDTAAILNRPASVAVDSRGGTASIAHWINSYFRLTGDNVIDKADPLVADMRTRVDDLYAQGRNTGMGDEELEVMVRRCDKDRYERLLFHKSK